MANSKFETQYSIFVSDAPDDNPYIPSFDFRVWQQLVTNDLNRIETTATGRKLLQSIGYWKMPVWIQPLRKPLKGGLVCNSRTTGPPHENEAYIDYSPMFLGQGSACSQINKVPGELTKESFVSLFHELVHAFRYVSGKNKRDVPVGKGLAFYDNKEEFIAVVVEGILLSELKRPIRSSHLRYFEIDPELNGSYKFFASSTETYKFIKEFCLENRGFTGAISRMNLSFNPIRAYYEKPAVAKSISQRSATARRRDAVQPVLLETKEFIKQQLSNLDMWIDNFGKRPTNGKGPSRLPFP